MTDLKYCMSCRKLRRADGFKQINRYRMSCAVCAAHANPAVEPKKRTRDIGTYIEKLRTLDKID